MDIDFRNWFQGRFCGYEGIFEGVAESFEEFWTGIGCDTGAFLMILVGVRCATWC